MYVRQRVCCGCGWVRGRHTSPHTSVPPLHTRHCCHGCWLHPAFAAAYDAIEAARASVVREATVATQRLARGWLARRHYSRCRRAIVSLQAAARGMRGRGVARGMRRQLAAVRLQAAVRRRVQRLRCVCALAAALACAAAAAVGVVGVVWVVWVVLLFALDGVGIATVACLL